MNLEFQDSLEQDLYGLNEKLGLGPRLKLMDGVWSFLSDDPKEAPMRLDLNYEFTYHERTFKTAAMTKEPLFKALGLKGGSLKYVIDASCGLGGDTLLMLAMGGKVTSYERHPLPALLFYSAFLHWKHPARERLDFVFGKVPEGLTAHVIYFDPMYGESQAKAKPRKEMRILRDILGVDNDAVSEGKRLKDLSPRFVVKRPIKSDDLLEKPTMSFKGKSTRYDVWLKI